MSDDVPPTDPLLTRDDLAEQLEIIRKATKCPAGKSVTIHVRQIMHAAGVMAFTCDTIGDMNEEAAGKCISDDGKAQFLESAKANRVTASYLRGTFAEEKEPAPCDPKESSAQPVTDAATP